MTTIDIVTDHDPTASTDGRETAFWRSWALVWVVGLFAILPLLGLYLRWIWQFEHYRYFPFLLLLCGGLVYQRWDRRISAPQGIIGWGAMAASLMLLLAGGVLYSPWLGSVAFVALSWSFLWSHHGVDGRRLIYIGIPLLLLVRLPLGYDQRLVVGLQSLTTQVSSFLLDLMAVPHDVVGNVIQLPDRQLLVAEACSGVQSAFTLCFVALALATWKRRPLLLLPLAVGMALLWAVLANTLRVTTIATAAYSMGVDLSSGWQHEVLGYIVLAIAILLVFSTDRLLVFLFHEIVHNADTESSNPLIRWWDAAFRQAPDEAASYAEVREQDDWQPSRDDDAGSRGSAFGNRPMTVAVLAGLFVLISVVPLSVVIASSKPAPPATAGGLLFQPPASLLEEMESPVQFSYDRRVRDGADPRLGTNADIWLARHPNFAGDVVFSQPYTEWHDLNVCYRVLNWQLLDEYRAAPPGDDDGPAIAISRFHHADGSYGYLLFGALMRDGNIATPPNRNLLAAMLDRCQNAFGRRPESSFLYGDVAMLQLWVTSPQPLSGEALSDAIESFADSRQRFSQAMTAAASGASASASDASASASDAREASPRL